MFLIRGTRITMPNKPYTTDGMPARSCTAGRTTACTPSGAISAKKIAQPNASGTPSRIAPNVTDRDPAIIARMPYWSIPGRQTVLKSISLTPISVHASMLSRKIKKPIARTIMIEIIALANKIYFTTLSAIIRPDIRLLCFPSSFLPVWASL